MARVYLLPIFSLLLPRRLGSDVMARTGAAILGHEATLGMKAFKAEPNQSLGQLTESQNRIIPGCLPLDSDTTNFSLSQITIILGLCYSWMNYVLTDTLNIMTE